MLYTYEIFDDGTVADAVELQVDPLQFGFSSVSSLSISPGRYFTGLTRDDVGALRYIYRSSNYNVEQMLPGTEGAGLGGGTGSPWTPWPPPGGGTNNFVDTALRPGVDKVTFQEAQYDSLLGSFIVFTNVFTDTYVSNSALVSQSVQRLMVQADLLFAAADLGVNAAGVPIVLRRTDTSGWANNNALNSQVTLDGPGVIQPQVTITFSSVGPYLINATPFLLSETFNAFTGFVWGSFDSTTNPPIVYPNGLSIRMMEQMVLGQ